jgi:hypothetical protein
VITASIPLEMSGGSLYNDTIEQIYYCTRTPWNPSDYDGVKALRFEVVVYGDIGTSVYLIDDSLTVYGTLTLNQSRIYQRLEVSVTPPVSSVNFYLKMDSQLSPTMNVRTARIWTDVEDADFVTVEIPLLHGDESSGGGMEDQDQNDYWAYCGSSTHPDFGYFGTGTTGPGTNENWFNIWKYETSKWATIDSMQFLVMGGRDLYGSDITGHVILNDKTASSTVTATELIFTETAPTLKSAVFHSTDLIDSHEYEVNLKAVNTGQSFYGALIYKAGIRIKLISCTALQVYMKCGTVINGYAYGSGGPDQDFRFDTEGRLKFDSSKFGDDTVFYFESTAKETGGNASLYAYPTDVEDHGIPAALGQPIAITDPGLWTDSAKILIQDNNYAYWTSTTSGQINTIQLTGFTFSSWVTPGLSINQILVEAIGNCSGSASSSQVSVRVNSGSWISQNWGPDNPIALGGHEYSIPGTWTQSDLESAVVELRCTHPLDTNSNTWRMDWIGFRVTYGNYLASTKLDFSTSTRQRQRTAALTDLVDSTRYITYVTATATPLHSISAHGLSFVIAEITGETPPTPPPVVPESCPPFAVIDDNTPNGIIACGIEGCDEPIDCDEYAVIVDSQPIAIFDCPEEECT